MKCLHIISAALMVALLGSRMPAEAQMPFGPPPQPQPTQPTAGVALTNHQSGYVPMTGPAYTPNMTYGSGINVGSMPPAYNPQTAGTAAQYQNQNLFGLRTAQASPVYGQPSAANGSSTAAPTANTYQQAVPTAPAVTENVYTGSVPSTPVHESAPMMTGPMVGNGAYETAMCGDWGASSVCPPCEPCMACPRWFGGVYGLILDRVDNDRTYFLTDPSIPSQLYGNSLDASMNTAGGVEARVGRTFGNCLWGLELVYWGLFPSDQCAHTSLSDTPASSLYLTPDYRGVYLDFAGGPTNGIDDNFNDGSIQRFELTRTYEYNNIELNLLSGPLFAAPACGGYNRGLGGAGCGGGACGGGLGLGGPSWSGLGNAGGLAGLGMNRCAPGPRWQAGWLFGVRYFKINETALMGYDNGDGYLDYFYGGDTEFFHQVHTENNLVGVQLGLNLDYFVTNCLQLDFGTKFGFYNNRIQYQQNIYNEYGLAYTNVDPATPQYVDAHTTIDDIAYVGEIRGGVAYRIGCHLRLTGGYRAIVASSIAEPLDQLAYGRTMGNANYLNYIDNSSSLILHGAYAGADFAW